MSEASSPTNSRHVTFGQVLRRRDFFLLWSAYGVSFTGDQITYVALGALALVLTGGQPLQMAIVLMLGRLPSFLFGWGAGVFVDRWDKRITMMVSDLIRAGLILSLTTVHTVWTVYIVTFLVATVSTFFEPARNAALPETVAPEELLVANSLMSTVNSIASFAGYGIGGLLVALVGFRVAFVVDFFSYLYSAWAAWRLSGSYRAAGESEGSLAGFWQDVRVGIVYHRENKVVLWLLIVLLLGILAIGGFDAVGVVIATAILGMSPVDAGKVFGLFSTAMGLGSFLGGLWLGRYGQRWPRLWLIGTGFMGCGVGMGVTAFSPDLSVDTLVFALLGFFNMLFFIPMTTWVQEATPLEVRGRVLAVRYMVMNGALVLTMVGAGQFAQVLGVKTAIWTMAILAVLAGAVTWWVPALRAKASRVPSQDATVAM